MAKKPNEGIVTLLVILIIVLLQVIWCIFAVTMMTSINPGIGEGIFFGILFSLPLAITFYGQMKMAKDYSKKMRSDDPIAEKSRKRFVFSQRCTAIISVSVMVLVTAIKLSQLAFIGVGFTQSDTRFIDESCWCGKSADGGCYKAGDTIEYLCSEHYRSKYKDHQSIDKCKKCGEWYTPYSDSGGYCRSCKAYINARYS